MSDYFPRTVEAQRTLVCVVGARPNLIKMAPLLAAFEQLAPHQRILLVHTGQHYGDAMDQRFFATLQMRQPDVNLQVGSGSHAQQTALIMQRFEPVLEQADAAAVLVVGDVNSTLACALVARKMNVPLIHVEAGLRSFDRGMPEEINRVLTDCMADLLFASEPAGVENLQREGVDAARIHFVGNVMLDSLYRNMPHLPSLPALLQTLALPATLAHAPGYALATLHRPANVDVRENFVARLTLLQQVARRLPVIFPLHPRSAAMLDRFELRGMLQAAPIHCIAPLDYLHMLALLKSARVVLTDSGGIQEEAVAVQVPCLTLRENTERPCTIESGGNVLVGSDDALAMRALDAALADAAPRIRQPYLWDGAAAPRIAQITLDWLAQSAQRSASCNEM